jgi:predicted anti-sigma-YlaC factor YlaD
MSAMHVTDQLSAYIDGECDAPHKIARHLQSCPDCARRHMELLKLSNHLSALQGPEPDRDFSQQVLARLEEKVQRGPAILFFMRRPALALALAATFSIVSAGVVFLAKQGSQTTRQAAQVNEAWLDDEAVILAFGDLLDAGVWVDPFVSDAMEDEEGIGDELPSVDTLVESLATFTLDDDAIAWYEEDDWIALMDLLAGEDAQVLSELATTHWDEV